MNEIERLQELVDNSNRIVFFGGAGVSTESGIPDYRSEGGLYSQKYKYPPEYMLSHSCWQSHTKEFYEFYRDKFVVADAKPNSAHFKLAELEKAGKLCAIITQNVDGLHQIAGSQKVFELHGSVHRNSCTRCGRAFGLEAIVRQTGEGDSRLDGDGIPRCACGGIIKPDVVLYEENLNDITVSGAVRALRESDLLIVAGTSLAVYPAAALIDEYGGKELVVINLSATERSTAVTLSIRGKVGETLNRIAVHTRRTK